jgi:hypothetical protein
MRSKQRYLSALALVIVVAMLAACTATTQLGKIKEGLQYDKELVESIALQAVVAKNQGMIPDTALKQVEQAYMSIRGLHNSAVEAVKVAEAREKSGQPWDRLQIEAVRATAMGAVAQLVGIAVQYKLIK